jgi:hypothetical protein
MGAVVQPSIAHAVALQDAHQLGVGGTAASRFPVCASSWLTAAS